MVVVVVVIESPRIPRPILELPIQHYTAIATTDELYHKTRTITSTRTTSPGNKKKERNKSGK